MWGKSSRLSIEDRNEEKILLLLPLISGQPVDLHPVVLDSAGNGWQEIDSKAWGLYPAAGLQGEGIIGGQRVRCLTPELQLRHHLGYVWDENDRHEMELLADRFGLALPPG